MVALRKVSPLIVASALTLAGCVSQPPLWIDSYSATGKPSPSFATGEIPTLYYTLTKSETDAGFIKVLRQPDRITVRREYILPSIINDGITSLDPNHPFIEEPVRNVQFPGLDLGNYTAELWIRGQLEGSLNFSVGARTEQRNTPSIRRQVVHSTTSVVSPRPALAKKFIETRVRLLDALVGLSERQKAEVARIYLDENARLQITPPNENGSSPEIVFQRRTQAKIRALLNPAQQSIYDETPEKFGGGASLGPDEDINA